MKYLALLSFIVLSGCGTVGSHFDRNFTDGPYSKATPYMGVKSRCYIN